MANFSTLPVYKRALDLDVQFAASTKKAPHDVKYGYINDIHNRILQLITDIAFANDYETERITWIKEAQESLRGIKIRVRILLDRKNITKKGFAAIIRAEESVARQLSGWYSAESSKNSNNNIIPGL